MHTDCACAECAGLLSSGAHAVILCAQQGLVGPSTHGLRAAGSNHTCNMQMLMQEAGTLLWPLPHAMADELCNLKIGIGHTAACL